MGVVQGISFERYPAQGSWLGTRVRVCYEYDAGNAHLGTCIRDDTEKPGEMIFHLDNGRVIRAVECQYSYAKEGE